MANSRTRHIMDGLSSDGRILLFGRDAPSPNDFHEGRCGFRVVFEQIRRVFGRFLAVTCSERPRGRGGMFFRLVFGVCFGLKSVASCAGFREDPDGSLPVSEVDFLGPAHRVHVMEPLLSL